MNTRIYAYAIPLALATPLTASAQPAITTRVDSFVNSELGRQRIPGVAIAVIRNGEPVILRGYGEANVEHRVPVTPSTIFQSGSLGKMFTSTLVMMLVEDGKLELDRSIAQYLPGVPEAMRQITVRHLLTHTSGIPDYTTGTLDYRKDYTEDQLMQLAFAMTPEFPAGARWNYSNTGYVLLGIIAGKAGGKFYGDQLRERVFAPLGMTTARVITEEDIVPNRSAGYRLASGELKHHSWVSPRLNTTADGSLYFSITDLVAWERGVRQKALLKPASWAQVLGPVKLRSGRPFPYGMGWSIDSAGGAPVHQHGGSWQGFRTQLTRYLGEDLTIIVLANLAQANPGRIAEGIAAIYNPALSTPAPAPIADNDPAVQARVRALLSSAAAGKLTPAEFAYVRAGFFPGAARNYETMLKDAGTPTKLTLMSRRQVGDDTVHRYVVEFGARSFDVTLALAPDGKVSQLSIGRRAGPA